MTEQHPITPPLELVGVWLCSEDYLSDASTFSSMTITSSRLQNVATRAARWGADQELEACCEWVGAISGKYGPRLRLARRPKPQSLKAQALKELKDWTDEKHGPGGEVFLCDGLSVATIRRALEALPDD